jgi:predicted dienelactone hydrolase
MDHVGNTTLDLLPLMAGAGSTPPDMQLLTGAAIEYRPCDVSLVLDALLAGEDADRIDAERVGMTGHSFGGWTTLASTRREPRIRASVALAPAGGSLLSGENPFSGSLDFEWGREVPTLYVVAERDSLLPIAGMRELFERTKSPKRFAVLGNADHQHFCDQAEQIHEFFRMMLAAAPAAYGTQIAQMRPISELCPGEHGYLCARGLGLAHFDAHLKQRGEAAAFLDCDACRDLAARGVDVEIA